MAETIQLKVITPLELVLDEQVDELVAPGELGEFGILPGHVPFLSTLNPGELRYRNGTQESILIINGGLADVKDDVVNILTDLAEYPENIDVVAAKKEVEAIESELSNLDEEIISSSRKDLEKKLKLAQVRASIK
ncbi:MAG: ATP synthase F1 subunit epsilon [Candidatus Dadabacteria bacterium]|nr:ATP synthase F1 subunit epsilon [Candidatus Dadabacteria bacterium]NIQ13587.1 ATP synthase F1 subunit epsilon [Candidatus Dadabacteria bacterium]